MTSSSLVRSRSEPNLVLYKTEDYILEHLPLRVVERLAFILGKDMNQWDLVTCQEPGELGKGVHFIYHTCKKALTVRLEWAHGLAHDFDYWNCTPMDEQNSDFACKLIPLVTRKSPLTSDGKSINFIN